MTILTENFKATLRNEAAGLPMSLSPKKVRTQARQFARDLFRDWHIVHAIIERHEDTIRKRWTKKSREQKKKILLTAWPGMATKHRPDVTALLTMRCVETALDESYEAFMWPYINLEDLLKPRPLLLLLNARGRNRPDVFVHSDLEQAYVSRIDEEFNQAMTPGYLHGYTMLFLDRSTADTYGELVSWDDDEDAFDMMYNGIGMHPEHGVLALEIQRRIWHFLVLCCKQLLQDMDPNTIIDGPVQPEPESLSKPSAYAPSLVIAAMEAPYGVSARLDFSRLLGLSSAERDACEDHLWQLREDPSYFAEVMRDHKQHRPEILLDTRGQKHPTLKQPEHALFWNRILGAVVKEAYFSFSIFDEIHRQTSELEKLEGKYKEVKPAKDPPKPYTKTFKYLQFLLDAAKKDLIDQLKAGFLPSPPMRGFCSRNPQDPNTTMIQTMYDPSQGTPASSRLVEMFRYLCDGKQPFIFDLHVVVDEIERLIVSEPDIKALVSPWVASRLASLSVISECLHQLHLYQPWARKIEDETEIHRNELLNSCTASFAGWVPILNVNFNKSTLHRLGDPTDGKFTYPAHRRRNKQNTEAMRDAEANLDAFWKAVDCLYKPRVSDSSSHDMVAMLLSRDRSIRRTPAWTEVGKENRKEGGMEYTYEPLSSIFHDPSKQITGAFNCTSLSDKPLKPKTRGITTTLNIPAEVAPVEPITDQQPIFPVDKRAHKVFKTLFYSPSSPDQPGEIPWTDFLHAMVSVGFGVEKLHGSGWNFRPSGLDVERGIGFHEPHPTNKIPYLQARGYGRRLQRAYGWNGDMFSLE
jgi:hypothetical protein